MPEVPRPPAGRVRFGGQGRLRRDASDVDLLIEFDDMPHADRADAYLGFLTAVEALFQRPVDLVEAGAVRNPYLRRELDESRELVFGATRGRGSRTSC